MDRVGSRQLEPGKRKSADHWSVRTGEILNTQKGDCRSAELSERSETAEKVRKVDGGSDER